jgi:hypothetical protein
MSQMFQVARVPQCCVLPGFVDMLVRAIAPQGCLCMVQVCMCTVN